MYNSTAVSQSADRSRLVLYSKKPSSTTTNEDISYIEIDKDGMTFDYNIGGTNNSWYLPADMQTKWYNSFVNGTTYTVGVEQVDRTGGNCSDGVKIRAASRAVDSDPSTEHANEFFVDEKGILLRNYYGGVAGTSYAISWDDIPLVRKYIYNSNGTGAGYRILCANGTATNFYIETSGGRYIFMIYQGGVMPGKLYYVDMNPNIFVSKLIVNASTTADSKYTIERTSITSNLKNNIKVTITSGYSEYLCIYEFRDA